MTVATTGDTDGDDFAITAGNGDSLFSIDAASGVISTTANALNYESATSHTLTISVSDGTNANTVTRDVTCLLYTSPSPRDRQKSRMPSSA